MDERTPPSVEHSPGEATTRTYRDHLDAGESACDACREAEADYKRRHRLAKRLQAAESFEEALLQLPEDDGEEFDELADLREVHRILRADMLVAKNSRERANTAKVRMEVGQRIKQLEAAAGVGKKKDPYDELQERRAERRAEKLRQA